MKISKPGWSLPFPLGWIVGSLLLFFGLRAIYHQVLPQAGSAGARVTSALLCKIYPPAAEQENPNAAPSGSSDITLLSGATLKLNAPAKATLDDTVVIDLCVEAKPELPPARRQALLDHLLVRLSGVGLQIEPQQQIPAVASSGNCLGTAAWTARANTAGRYTAVLVPESTDQKQNRAAVTKKPLWDFTLEQPAQLNIQFQPAWTDYVQKSWGFLSTALGTILVFTQVIQNLRRKKANAS
jgi:hypothetical protein